MEIGNLYQAGKTQLSEEVSYRYDSAGHVLVLVLSALTAEQIQDSKKGTVELAMYEDGPVIFLLSKFGDNGKWNDAPYSWHLMSRSQQVLPDDLAEGAGAKMKVILVNADNGMVEVIRTVIMGHDFVEQLHAAIHKQASGRFNGQSYAKHLNGIWNQYTPEEMVEMAQARCKVEPI
ncbi:MAG TPA: hypothetical protein VGL27_15785 [Negativicutes bacterium]|jgi:hypothetical protein